MNIPRGAPGKLLESNRNRLQWEYDNQERILNGHTNCQDQGLKDEKMGSDEDECFEITREWAGLGLLFFLCIQEGTIDGCYYYKTN